MNPKRIVAVIALFLAGCATSPAPHKKIAVVSDIHLPPNYTVIGQVEGYDTSDLMDKARARDGDAITTPTFVGLHGQIQSNVLKDNTPRGSQPQ